MTTTPAPEAAERLDTLEIRVAYQDHVIEQLNQSVLEYWRALRAAEARINRLEQRLQDALSRMPAEPGDEPPPPHY